MDINRSIRAKSVIIDGKSESDILPKNYDLRTEFPGKIGEVLSQGSCQSCWAFSVCQSLSDRIRINYPKELRKKINIVDDGVKGKRRVKDVLCPFSMVSCKEKVVSEMRKRGEVFYNDCSINNNGLCMKYGVSDIKEMGCTGGYLPHAHYYMHIFGTPRLSDTNFTTYDKCLVNSKTVKSTGFRAVNKHERPKTIKECEINEKDIMREIYSFGTVSAGFIINKNFVLGMNDDGSDSLTKEGLFYYPEGDVNNQVNRHAVTIIGWGEMDVNNIDISDTKRSFIKKELAIKKGRSYILKYWICRNSYGINHHSDKEGYFLLPKGVNFNDIESEVWASYIS